MINAVSIYRIARRCYKFNIPFIPKILKLIIFLIYNSSIPYEAQIGKETKFGYSGIGCVIHKNAIIGDRCIISQGVTIGGQGVGNIGVPVIKSDVFIGAGAKVLGNITIGNNVVIGANTVVTKSIPENAVVAGVPGKILYYRGKEVE